MKALILLILGAFFLTGCCTTKLKQQESFYENKLAVVDSVYSTQITKLKDSVITKIEVRDSIRIIEIPGDTVSFDFDLKTLCDSLSEFSVSNGNTSLKKTREGLSITTITKAQLNTYVSEKTKELTEKYKEQKDSLISVYDSKIESQQLAFESYKEVQQKKNWFREIGIGLTSFIFGVLVSIVAIFLTLKKLDI